MSNNGTTVPHIDREIGDHSYRAGQLKLTAWADLTEHLAKMLGQPFGQALRGGTLDLDAFMGAEAMVAVLALVTERLSAKDLLLLLDLAGQSLQLQGGSGGYGHKQIKQWHGHFQQNMGNLAPAVLLFLEAQYSDFFDGLRQLVPEPSNDPDDPQQSTDQNSEQSPST